MARVPQWCGGAVAYRLAPAAVGFVFEVTKSPAILVHATLVAGAAAARLDIYNKSQAPIDVTKRVDVLIATAGDDDMFSNKPIECPEGIIAVMNQADSEGFIYYIPTPT